MLKIKIQLLVFDKLKEGGTAKKLVIYSLNLKNNCRVCFGLVLVLGVEPRSFTHTEAKHSSLLNQNLNLVYFAGKGARGQVLTV